MKRSVLAVMIVLAVLGAAACTRQLSTPSVTQAPDATAPAVEGNVMTQLGQFATQTAIASGAQPVVVDTMVAPETTDAAQAAVEPTQAPAGNEPQPTTEPAAPGVEPVVVEPAQPAQPVVVVPTSTPGIPTSYTIERGESPYCIARRFNLDPSELLALNGLGSNSIVQPGAVLKIPQGGSPFPAQRALRPHPATYVVSGDETIYEVACYYGDVSPEGIIAANALESPYRLKSGQKLQIP